MNNVFKEIFNYSPVAMLLVDENSKIILVNKHATTLFDYKKEDLIGQDIAILLPQDVKHHHPTLVKDYFSSPLPRKMGVGRTLFGIRKDQTKFPVEVGLNPIQADGHSFVMSSVIDITQRSKAEERFKVAIDAAPNGMLMINDQGTIIFCNQKVEKIFGYEKNELLNQPIEILVPQDLKPSHPTFVQNYLKTPEPRAMGAGRELFGKHKTGELIPVEIGLQPLFFDNESFVISSIVDISQRRHHERKLESQADELKEFAYRTSHDLKSPLLTMGGLTDYIIEDIKVGDLEASLASAEKIKLLVFKLNRLIEDILTLTKADLDTEEKKPFDFETYLQDAKEKFAFLLQENAIKLEHSFLHKIALQTQQTRLTQVLDNLISNAAKYCNTGPERFIKFYTFNDAEKFYIHIEDNGQGIPKEKQKEAFGMFKRFHASALDGTGLGLYMVKKHLSKLNARIDFKSTPAGTIFYLEFPI